MYRQCCGATCIGFALFLRLNKPKLFVLKFHPTNVWNSFVHCHICEAMLNLSTTMAVLSCNFNVLVIHVLCSYSKPSEYVTAWWYWAPVGRGKPRVSTCWWRPWRIVGHRTEKWEWTLKPSLLLRCLEDWTLLQMIGLTEFSLLSGEKHFVPRKVCFDSGTALHRR